jgi:predicted nucleic acid-binding protein
MLAIDTDVVVRYLIGDHPGLSAQARPLIDSEAVFVCTTVLLESEWVLRSTYGYAPAQLAKALRAFGGLPRVTIEDPDLAARALDWLEAGMDFADALHLAAAGGRAGFASFDRRLAQVAKRIGGVRVRTP